MTRKEKLLATNEFDEIFREFSEDVGSLWASPQVPHLTEEPTPMVFLREHVSRSVPCIIPYHGPGVGLTLDKLEQMVKESENDDDDDIVLSVDVTPDGFGDCVRPVIVNADHSNESLFETIDMFVKPEQRKMTITEFRTKLREWRGREINGENVILPYAQREFPLLKSFEKEMISLTRDCKDCSVFYYSKQNDCLRTELKKVFDLNLFPDSIPFAEEAFGEHCFLEAVNIWIGDERAISSMHKDHYENLFIVLSGEKVFTICPPSDAIFLPEEDFPAASFRFVPPNKGWLVEEDHQVSKELKSDETVKWIKYDILNVERNNQRYPYTHLTHPIEVKVKEGEMIYLPSLWLHR